MRLPAILLLIAISGAWTGNLPIKTLIFPAETDNSYAELIPQREMRLSAFTLCMRLATELSGNREVILFANRTQDYDELNVWREKDGRLSIYMSSGEGALFQVPGLGAMQTHLCVTWDSSSGATALFMDGRKSLTKIYRKGHTVRAGGRAILGQDPDNFLGSFDSSQSFVGEITDVNMWDSVLSDGSIKELFSGGSSQRGNVFDWHTIQPQIIGSVEVVQYEA